MHVHVHTLRHVAYPNFFMTVKTAWKVKNLGYVRLIRLNVSQLCSYRLRRIPNGQQWLIWKRLDSHGPQQNSETHQGITSLENNSCLFQLRRKSLYGNWSFSFVWYKHCFFKSSETLCILFVDSICRRGFWSADYEFNFTCNKVKFIVGSKRLIRIRLGS